MNDHRRYRDSKTSGHAVQVIRMLAHRHDFRDNGLICPLDSENLCQFLQVLGGSFSNREHGITQPAHTQGTELFIKELYAQLTSKKRDVFDYSKSNAPLLVFSELNNRRKERL